MILFYSAVALQLLLVGGVVVFLWLSHRPHDQGQGPPEPELELPSAFLELELRVENLERRWHGLLEELEERIERGNKAFRRARASERRQELQDEDEDEYQTDLELPPRDAGGGGAPRVPALPGVLDSPGAGDAVEMVNAFLAMQALRTGMPDG